MTKLVQMKKADLPNGETLAYREREGGTKTVLLIHGNMTSSKHWDVLIDELDDDFKVIAVDLRGFGESSYVSPIQQIKDFSDDINHFVSVLDLQDFAIIGWSKGGAVAMEYCADYPGRCTKLVLLASASTRGYPFYGVNVLGVYGRLCTYEEIKREPTKTIPIQHAYDTGNQVFLKVIWNSSIYTQNKPEPCKYEEYIDDMMTQRNLAEVYHSLNIFNISSKHNGLVEGNGKVSAITIPVLVLRGDKDLVVTEQMTKEIIEDLGSNAIYKELMGCGHSPLIDNLHLLNEEIQAYLNNLKGACE